MISLDRFTIANSPKVTIEQKNWFTLANNCLERAYSIDPNSPDILAMYGFYYVQWGVFISKALNS